MEKRVPSFPLEQVKKLIFDGRCKFTETARRSAHFMGFSDTEAKDIVASLERKDFTKSATDFYNSASWQDYYKKKVGGFHMFIKLKITQVDDQLVLILSFKRDENAEGER